ncbi:ribosome biogenesis factor YjgA [Thalassotalea ponticola]|uniref:ribosome biogenesis factor YjgA n=1 Tax=Thalassotalea ponticola TaxID=1523392 RepID=UPI0025B2FA81|nr:ribosome biogenesis factor YjgA [Thalassotalea ponticola]MDN3653506.1 ribosome biogenesis factor YjgA [Thalassotalea ponticola]
MAREIGEYDEENDILYVSKTELKQDMKDLQKLAEAICHMGPKQRAKLALNSEIEQALVIADKIKGKHDAFHRNVQFIAKQLHSLDVEAIRLKIDIMENKHGIADAHNRFYEELREQILSADNQTIETLINDNSSLERQRLRQLIRQANKEVKQSKPGKSYKELFKYLKQHVAYTPSA